MYGNNNSSRLPSAKTLVALFALALPGAAAYAHDNTPDLKNRYDEKAVSIFQKAREAGIEDACNGRKSRKLKRASQYIQVKFPNAEDPHPTLSWVKDSGYRHGVEEVIRKLDWETPCEDIKKTREEKSNNTIATVDLSPDL